MGWENARPDRPPPAPRGAHFPSPMDAVEVGVVAWLAWGVVVGLLGMVWGGSGAVWG